MPDNKQKLRDLFSDKTSDEQPAEETIATDEVAVSTEDAPMMPPEAPIGPEAPVEGGGDVVKEAKDIYSRWEKSDDPVAGLDQLIGELQALRDRQGGLDQVLPGDSAPLNDPMNI